MKSRVDFVCVCGDGWHGPVPARFMDYVKEQWDRKHKLCAVKDPYKQTDFPLSPFGMLPRGRDSKLEGAMPQI